MSGIIDRITFDGDTSRVEISVSSGRPGCFTITLDARDRGHMVIELTLVETQVLKDSLVFLFERGNVKKLDARG